MYTGHVCLYLHMYVYMYVYRYICMYTVHLYCPSQYSTAMMRYDNKRKAINFDLLTILEV